MNGPDFDAFRQLVRTQSGLVLTPDKSYLVAVDTVGAGVGELVLVMDEGTGARQILGSADGPVRSVIAGIVDAV